MIMSASASAAAAPPMSFFISSIAASGLMSRPPVSKETPLPTRVTRGAAASPQVRSIRRGARGRGAADGVDHREVLRRAGRRRRSPSTAAPCFCRERPRRVLDLLRAEVVRRRVDEVAAERRRRGDARRLLGIDAGRGHEPAGLCRPLPVAVEAVGAEEPGERRELGLGGRRREAIGPGREHGRQLADEEADRRRSPRARLVRRARLRALRRGRAGGNGRRACASNPCAAAKARPVSDRPAVPASSPFSVTSRIGTAPASSGARSGWGMGISGQRRGPRR